MNETQVTRTVSTQQVPGATVRRENVQTSNQATSQMYALAKTKQVIWFIAHAIAILLLLRFAFLALGANLTGIVLFIYNLSAVFVLPFRGIFASPSAGEFYFDSAALLGIALYYLLALLIVKLLDLFSNTAEV